VVISDWGAVHDTKLASESGLDLEMDVKYQFDEQYMADPLLKAVKSEITTPSNDQSFRSFSLSRDLLIQQCSPFNRL